MNTQHKYEYALGKKIFDESIQHFIDPPTKYELNIDKTRRDGLKSATLYNALGIAHAVVENTFKHPGVMYQIFISRKYKKK